MNNYEKIKAMSIDEMAEEFTKITATHCDYCPFQNECEPQEIFCKKFLKQWLESEEE